MHALQDPAAFAQPAIVVDHCRRYAQATRGTRQTGDRRLVIMIRHEDASGDQHVAADGHPMCRADMEPEVDGGIVADREDALRTGSYGLNPRSLSNFHATTDADPPQAGEEVRRLNDRFPSEFSTPPSPPRKVERGANEPT
jgi:hypothetical protein